jgi:hypothetical protein
VSVSMPVGPGRLRASRRLCRRGWRDLAR